MKLNLDERLRGVLNAVSGVGTLADIGCDHGKISVGALIENRAERVIAIDISERSLQKTVALATEFGVKLTAVQSDGLTKVKDKIDLGVVAGLGGNEIIKIISDAGIDRCDFLCVAHQDEWRLREFLSGKFHIESDSVTECSGKYYSIIVAKREGEKTEYTKNQLYCGLNLPASEAYAKMLMAKRSGISRITAVHKVPSGELTTILEEVEKECARLKI